VIAPALFFKTKIQIIMTNLQLNQGKEIQSKIKELERIKDVLSKQNSDNIELLTDFFTKMQNVSSSSEKKHLAGFCIQQILEKLKSDIEKLSTEFENL
jgi:hypothetical protein